MEKPFLKILVPTDFSAGADAAIETALALRRECGAAVTLLHVFDPPLVYTEGYTFSAELLEKMERGSRQAMHELLTRTETRAQTIGREAPAIDAKVVAGGAPQEIVELAANGGYDLIVLGTHGHTGLHRMLIGSVAEQVVRRAPCDVWSVRPLSRSDPTLAAGPVAGGTPPRT